MSTLEIRDLHVSVETKEGAKQILRGVDLTRPLTDAEVAEFQPQLEAILNHVESLTRIDVSSIEPTAHAAPVFDRMRDDVPHQSLAPGAVLQNAPDQAQGQIRVPKVVTDA